MSTTTANLPLIGTALPALGGTLGAWMAYADGSVHGLIVSDRQHAFRSAWGPRKRIPGATGIDGMASTQAMAAAGSVAARRMLDLCIDGLDGWFLGSRLEALALHQHSPELFPKELHWTSTQFDADRAWDQFFGSGYQGVNTLSFEAWCRPLRRLALSHFGAFDGAPVTTAAEALA